MNVRVKICGITRVADAALALDLGAEIIGLNFHPPSPRCLPPDRALALRRHIGSRALVVGVFVNAPRDQIEELRRTLGLDLLQFHGDEEPSALAGWPVPVIRALRLKPGDPVPPISAIAADYVLLDTFDPGLFGGTGRPRPLEGLARLDLARVFLSGGLDPDNVGAAAALHPYAVDVASGVESAPGIKDPIKLRSFITNAKSAR